VNPFSGITIFWSSKAVSNLGCANRLRASRLAGCCSTSDPPVVRNRACPSPIEPSRQLATESGPRNARKPARSFKSARSAGAPLRWKIPTIPLNPLSELLPLPVISVSNHCLAGASFQCGGAPDTTAPSSLNLAILRRDVCAFFCQSCFHRDPPVFVP
jgi:hypothetical protein